MTISATNCWDYFQCDKANTCPAYPNHGLGCWEITGTMCRGERQGDREEKIGACRSDCGFHSALMCGDIQPHIE